MRFALLGNHPDGWSVAAALVESGRHTLVSCTGSISAEWRERLGAEVRTVTDLEEVLADPSVEAIIVAGSPANRAIQLRRALQSEHHVLCVHPPGQSPDVAYEAALVRGDTGMVLLPLLSEAVHPGVDRLGELVTEELGPLRLIELEIHGSGPVLLDADVPGHKPSLAGWDVLRRLGGEIAEVSAFAVAEEVTADTPLLVSGRFERGGLFRATYLPDSLSCWQLVVRGSRTAELLFPSGRPGSAVLRWRTGGEEQRQEWQEFDPWPVLAEAFEVAVAAHAHAPEPELAPTGAAWRDVRRELQPGAITQDRPPQTTNDRETPLHEAVAPEVQIKGTPQRARWRPVWDDTVRCLELDDAVRHSVERRRSSTLEYQEASEEVGFKGTMTLLGCGVLWLMLFLLILSIWVPALGWFILPVLGVFLILQLFLYTARQRPAPR